MRFETTCLNHAELAYQSEPEILQRFEASGIEPLAWLRDTRSGTFGYVCRLPMGQALVAFRGSEVSVADWKTNLDLSMEYESHRGFWRAAESVIRDVTKAVSADDKIVLTGHSLGGAIATVTGYILARSRFDVTEVHSFGAPRTGSDAWCQRYNRHLGNVTFRHVNCCDVVPRLPSMWRGYVHVGQEVYYDSEGDAVKDAGMTFKFFDRGLARVRHWGKIPTRGIADHALSAYRKVVLSEAT